MLLFSSIIEDEERSFSSLYNAHVQDMLKYAAYLLSSPHDAEDIVQEAFMRAAKYKEKSSSGGCHNPRGLLVIIVRNLCYSKLRRDGRASEVSWEKLRLDEGLADAAITYDRTHFELVDLIERLGTDHSDVLKLKYLYGYTSEESARLLGLTPETVRARVSRAYKKLRAMIEKEGIP